MGHMQTGELQSDIAECGVPTWATLFAEFH